MTATDSFRALGHRVTTFEGFETFSRPKGTHRVVCTSDEVTALCPITHQPDQYTVEVEYYPEAVCLESKSLKLYFHAFRNEGLFVEALAARMARDIGLALSCPVWITITQKPRGGIEIKACAHYDGAIDDGSDAG